jgi:uncharacterized protein YhfF
VNGHAAFFARCRAANPDIRQEAPDAVRGYGQDAAMSQILLSLILSGRKTGTFSLPGEGPGREPAAGDLVLVTDHGGQPALVYELLEVRRLPFLDVGPAELACEGPALRDVDAWRALHRDYWQRLLALRGERFDDAAEVLFQRFRVRFPQP